MTKNLLGTVFSPVKALAHPTMREYIGGQKLVYPITYELGPAGPGNCNNKCNFCMHASYYNAKAIMGLDLYTQLIDEIKELSQGRPTGMIYSASGEPLTNPNIIKFLEYTSEKGIDQALITNGSAWGKPGLMKAVLKHVSWTRTSLDAGTSETRKKIHGVHRKDFENVLKSLTQLAKMKKATKSQTHIGAQIVVTPSNYKDIVEATGRVSKTGIDYFQIKPVVYHPRDNKPQEPREFWETVVQISKASARLYKRPEGHIDGEFNVFIKDDQFGAIMESDHDKGAYDTCRAIFFPIIEADGSVFHCSQTRGIPEFELGNLNKQGFEEIWHSKRRQEVLKGIDVSKCQPVCRCHWTNRMLSEVMDEKKLKKTKPSFQ